MPRERVIFISGLQIFPPLSGGQLRTANLARKISESSDVVVYSMTGRKKDYLSHTSSNLHSIAPHLEEFVNRSRFFGILQFLSYRLHLPPLWLTVIGHLFLPKGLQQYVTKADRVIIDHPYLYPIFRWGRRERILNTHNVEHHLWRRSWWTKVFVAPIVKKIESKAILGSQQVWCCSAEEKEVLFAMGQGRRPVVVVPNFVPPMIRSEQAGRMVRSELSIPVRSKVILFTASQYAPNIDALNFLSEFALSHHRLLEQLDVFILVVGSVSASQRREGRLIVTGPVAEVTSYFSAADLAINPVTAGSGTNLKMFEYQAAGIPILSTSFGARGLNLVEGIDFKPFRREELDRVLQQELGAR